MTEALMSNYARLPVAFERGEGVWLWDTEGRRYLDALAGIAVCGLGHAHPSLSAALCEQARTLIHTSNLYGVPLQERLAERLCKLSSMERVFFANSGAEANEAAIKLARLHGHQRSIERPGIVVMEGSFHGRTLATLTATGNTRIQQGFEPLVEGFVRVPYDDLDAVHQAAEQHPEITAVLVEPITGEGGIRVPDPGYLRGLRELCDQRGWLLMLDEIQAGIGRTGRWFAFQHADIRPDVMTLAKGLANGVPIGACLAAGPAADLFGPGSHGSTFGGNPLVCRAALSVLEVIERDGLLARATEIGDYLRKRLRERLRGQEGVLEIRGLGLMIGIQLAVACKELVGAALARGLLINVTADSVVRLLPPLILEREQADIIADTLGDLIGEFLAARQQTA
jgi:acetylornithine aminotransferase